MLTCKTTPYGAWINLKYRHWTVENELQDEELEFLRRWFKDLRLGGFDNEDLLTIWGQARDQVHCEKDRPKLQQMWKRLGTKIHQEILSRMKPYP